MERPTHGPQDQSATQSQSLSGDELQFLDYYTQSYKCYASGATQINRLFSPLNQLILEVPGEELLSRAEHDSMDLLDIPCMSLFEHCLYTDMIVLDARLISMSVGRSSSSAPMAQSKKGQGRAWLSGTSSVSPGHLEISDVGKPGGSPTQYEDAHFHLGVAQSGT